MKYSDITKLKHLAQDKISRSANPAIVRNSTIFFKSMQELLEKEKVVKKGSKVNFYEYGRAGSQTTIALQNFIAELELAHATFLTSTGFSSVALAIISICRPGDEIVVTAMEHHSNLVPWQKVASDKKATLKIIPLNEDQTLDLTSLNNSSKLVIRFFFKVLVG